MRIEKLNVVFEKRWGINGGAPNYFVGDTDVMRFIFYDVELQKKLLYLLRYTNPFRKMNPDLIKLPFENVFLDCELNFSKLKIPYGILITTTQDDITDLQYNISFAYSCGDNNLHFMYLSFDAAITKESIFEINFSDHRLKQYNTIDDADRSNNIWCAEALTSNKDGAIGLYRYLKLDEVLNFIYNWLLFLHDPRVSIQQGKHINKQFAKRIYEFNYPKNCFVIIDPELRQHIYSTPLDPGGVAFKYNYKFMVRGHFRRLRNNKYKVKKVMWIMPFYKGQGILYKKDYRIDKKMDRKI